MTTLPLQNKQLAQQSKEQVQSAQAPAQKESLHDFFQILSLKRLEQDRFSLRFKEIQLESIFTQNILPNTKRAHSVLQAFLLVQQLIWRAFNDLNSSLNVMWIVFIVCMAIALLLTNTTKFKVIQGVSFMVNLLATLTLAECFTSNANDSSVSSPSSTKLRVLYNGAAFIMCFWVHSAHLVLDAICLTLCFILMQVFRGVSTLSVLFSITSIVCVIYLKREHQKTRRETFQAQTLSQLWQKVLFEDINTLQIIALHYNKTTTRFSFQGSLNTSNHLPKVESDEQVNQLLEQMLYVSAQKAPNYQMKELSRSIGKNIKDILIRLLDDINWSYYSKSEKVYILHIYIAGFHYKLNIRGINSLDDTFIMTLGLADTKAVDQLNRRCEITQNLLSLQIQNASQRLSQMRQIIDSANAPSPISVSAPNPTNVLIRTTESLACQSNLINVAYQSAKNPLKSKLPGALKRQVVKQINQRIVTSMHKNLTKQSKNNEVNSFLKINQYQSKINTYGGDEQQQKTNVNLNNNNGNNANNGNSPTKVNDELQKSQKPMKNSNQISGGNSTTLAQSPFSYANSGEANYPMSQFDYIFENEEDCEQEDKGRMQNSQVNLPTSSGCNLGNSFNDESFNLKMMVEDVAQLYSSTEVMVSFQIDKRVNVVTSAVRFRWFLISLFENAMQLKLNENIECYIEFKMEKGVQNEFSIEMKVAETTNSDSSIENTLRYANGKNLELIKQIEVQNILDFVQSIGGADGNPIKFNQDKQSNLATLTMILSTDWQRDLLQQGANPNEKTANKQSLRTRMSTIMVTNNNEANQLATVAAATPTQNFSVAGDDEEMQRLGSVQVISLNGSRLGSMNNTANTSLHQKNYVGPRRNNTKVVQMPKKGNLRRGNSQFKQMHLVNEVIADVQQSQVNEINNVDLQKQTVEMMPVTSIEGLETQIQKDEVEENQEESVVGISYIPGELGDNCDSMSGNGSRREVTTQQLHSGGVGVAKELHQQQFQSLQNKNRR